MKVVRAKILGFCAGVRRAVVAAEKALDENKGQVYTLGPLIHNPVALNKLAERNLKILVESKIPLLNSQDTVIIRAHGVPPDDKNHGEVIGIEGYAREGAKATGKPLHFLLVKDVEELKHSIRELSSQKILSSDSKIVLLSQTTFSIKMFDNLQAELKSSFPNAEVISSICPATHERQDSLVELCKKVDGIIVIGGKNSANTNRLFATAQKLCKKAVLIETPEEIPSEFFELEIVGITAGASTPDDTIDAVEARLKS